MSKRVLILVEGQTEERFVKDVLAPHFFDRQLFFFPTILVTKRVKDGPNFKGGVTNFAKFQNDAQRLLNGSGDALVTMLLDYYRLPTDFPGMESRPMNGTALQRVTHVEMAIAQHFGSLPNLLPFLVLHEFEAIRASVATPEEINERPEHAPSKRIEAMFPAYKKTLHGPTTAGRIGLERIRAECPHFNNWMNSLESFATP